MKPDEQQKQWLKAYLRTLLKYRETYEEVYDHILLALEARPQEKSFENMVNTIIADDFGGNSGLLMMEKRCRNAVITEVRKQYWRYFYSYLKFPHVIFTAVIAIIAGHIAMHVSYHVIMLSGAIWWAIGAIVIPVLWFASRRIKTNYKFDGPKKLLKGSILARLGGKSFKFFWLYFFLTLAPYDAQTFNSEAGFDAWKYIGPLIFVIVFVTVAIHALSFIKLIKEEFKISILR